MIKSTFFDGFLDGGFPVDPRVYEFKREWDDDSWSAGALVTLISGRYIP